MKNNNSGFLAAILAFMLVFSAIALADRGNKDNEDSGIGLDGSLDTDIDADISAGNGDDATEIDADAQSGTNLETNIGSDGIETEIESENEINAEADDDSAVIKTREMAREKIKDMQGRFEEQQKKILEVRKKYMEVKVEAEGSVSEYMKVKQRWMDANAEGKQHIRTELNLHARVALLHQVEALLKYLESVKERGVDSNGLDELMAEWEDRKERLEDVNISGSELLEISKEIRENWLTHRSFLKKQIGLYVSSKINGLTEKAETFVQKYEQIIADLNAEGKDVTLLQKGLDKLKADLNLFADAQAKLKLAFEDANNSQSSNDAIRQANQLLKAMQEQLKKDFRLMKTLFKATRELNSSVSISASTNAEINASLREKNDVDDELEELEQEDEGDDD